MLVQIYGITTPGDAAIVNELRPDHVGVVLDEGIDAWDSVDERTVSAIVHQLTDTRVVALSLSVQRDRIMQTVETVSPEVLHLARAADEMSMEDLSRLRADIDPIELMVTVPVRDVYAIATAQAFAPVCDFFLLDTAHPATGVVGASGFVHDWSISRAIVEAVDTRVLLAGGLGPENVLDAIDQVRPAGVDSETRTSVDGDRRRKDPDKVRVFIERARTRRLD